MIIIISQMTTHTKDTSRRIEGFLGTRRLQRRMVCANYQSSCMGYRLFPWFCTIWGRAAAEREAAGPLNQTIDLRYGARGGEG